ncbi:MAG TPA: hypothetical protein VFL13_06490 [Candidatus Baltobacteraceae bacterium]|nr:hypothetical protein [Candidatus Baltobacteraceae bacterium]
MRTRRLRSDLEVLSAEIHSQLAENERQRRRCSINDEHDAAGEAV